jgi:anaerobic selenocysteine-containing dehydrogenase
MQSNATQIARAIAQLYALTGSFDAPGGNVLFAAVPAANVAGEDLLSPEQRARTLGRADRPLGPARWQHVTSDDVYRGILDRRPYPVRGLVGFGANLLMAHADSGRGRQALSALDFLRACHVHDLTVEQALVPPVASVRAQALRLVASAGVVVQLRPRSSPARADSNVFDLARRLGRGDHFFDGDIEAAWRHQLAPSGVTLDALRANPGGVRVPLQTRHRKFAEESGGAPRGFATPTRKIELYSETMREHGYPALPVYEPPLVGPSSRPDLARRFPLILTCAKHLLFCETQHRALPSLRRHARDPEVELHPAAAARGSRPARAIETPRAACGRGHG